MRDVQRIRLSKPQTLVYRTLKPHTSNCIPWGRGLGKALALDTRLPTPTGWTTMGAVKVGDTLFDEQGRQCSVQWITEVMTGHDCFDVVFDDGTKITADADHQWLTWCHAARKSHGRAGPGRRPGVHPQVRTTRQIRESLVTTTAKRETNHSVHVAGAIDTPQADLPIHPYALGAWLGDGTSCCGAITIGDEDHDEMVRMLRAVCPKMGVRRGRPGASTYALGIQGLLHKLGVISNKHIPAVYMRASQAQRRQLLAGLLDTDGHCTKDGAIEFCNTNQTLINSVYELVVSLGFKANIYTGRAYTSRRAVTCSGSRERTLVFPQTASGVTPQGQGTGTSSM